MKQKKTSVLVAALFFGGMLSAQKTQSDSVKTQEIQAVIVTALGIKKEKRSLTYSAQEVSGEAFTQVKDANPMNSLSGRVAGLNIGRSSSGVGGSVKITLRGMSSSRNNQPLFVVDGVPISNASNSQPNSIFGSFDGNRDGGDVLSLINPDDIESIVVLRGASSSALYGSQGANGVINITTKKGKSGKLTINLNSNTTFETAAYFPKLQHEYLASNPGVGGESWGKKGNSSRVTDSFFKTGMTMINSIALSGGNDKFSSYLSFANTNSSGIIPTSSMKQNNFAFRETMNFFENKLKVDASVNLSEQKFHNKPSNGLYMNPLVGVYAFPRGEDFNHYFGNFSKYNPARFLYDQNRFPNTAISNDVEQNPGWILNRTAFSETNKRAYMKGSVTYEATDWLSFQARASYDNVSRKYERKMFAGTELTLSPLSGRYILQSTEDTQWYTDFIATANKSFNQFDISVLLGASKNDYNLGDGMYADSGYDSGGLKIPNYFHLGNFVNTNGLSTLISSSRQIRSVFGSAQLAYDKAIYLDLTARQDWSTALSKSFFYPSVGLTAIISKYVNFGSKVNFLKLRASYAEVGNDIPSFIQGNRSFTYVLNQNGDLRNPLVSSFPGKDLLPELKKNYEAGLEARLFNNRIGFEFTYYHTNTINQYFEINAPANLIGIIKYAINGGDIETKGMEATLNYTPIKTTDFEWNGAINFGTNKSYIKSLSDLLKQGDRPAQAVLNDEAVNGYAYVLREGERFGTILVKNLVRDSNGLPIFDKVTDDKGNVTGYTPRGSAERVSAGTPFPDWTAGLVNTFNYKNFSLNVVIDGKVGGKGVSITQAMLDAVGTTQATADARNNNGGKVNVSDGNGNTIAIDAAQYYRQIGSRNGYSSEYVYSLTNFRLAELSLGYTFKPKVSFIQKANISLIGRNLFFIYKQDKNIPFDPNVVSSTGENFQGIDVFGQPSTRSFGVNLSVNF